MLLKSFQDFYHDIGYRLYNHTVHKKIGQVLLLLVLCFLCAHAFADDGTDLLQGTDASAWATLTGTGKKYIYMIEFVLAIASYMATRKLIVFTGFVVISVTLDMVLHFAEQGS